MHSHAERGNDRAELCGCAVVPAGVGGGAGGEHVAKVPGLMGLEALLVGAGVA